MANYTTNYNLTLPLPEEYYDIAVFNDNAEIIDNTMANTANAVSTLNNTVTNINSSVNTSLVNINARLNNAVYQNQIGIVGGVAGPLDSNGQIPVSQVPNVSADVNIVANLYTLNPIRIGNSAATSNIAIGGQATATALGTSIGYYANAAAASSIAVGSYASATGSNSIAIGNNSSAPAILGTAFGYYANALGTYSIAIGPCSQSSNTNAIVIGYNASSQCNASVVIGSSSRDSGENSVSIGRSCLGGLSSVAIGNSVVANYRGAIGIGNMVTSTGWAAISIGECVSALAECTIAIGRNLSVSGVSSIIIGNSGSITSTYSTAIGFNAKVTGAYSTSIGYNTLASGERSSVFGPLSTASGASSVAIGSNATSSGINSIALGLNSNAVGTGSIAIGHITSTTVTYGIAIGVNTGTTGQSSIAIGTATRSGVNSVAMGYASNAQLYSAAYGFGAIGNAQYSTAIGPQTTAYYYGSTAIGWNARAPAANGIRIGGVNVTSFQGQVSYSPTSDERDKYVVSNLDNKALEAVLNIETIAYNWNNRFLYEDDNGDVKLHPDSKYNSTAHSKAEKRKNDIVFGFKAQQIANTMNDIFGDKDYGSIIGCNKPQDENLDGEETFLVTHDRILPLIVKSIQELYKQNEELKEKILRMESNING